MHHLYSLLRILSWGAVLMALGVIMLGAWVRLSDAGLGCPDWPACYGHITWPSQPDDVARAQINFPDRPVEAHKAWKEVVHRYFAGLLGLLILVLAALDLRLKKHLPALPVTLAFVVVGLVLVQAAFGMWTVTLKLLPWMVTAHLLGGMAIAALLFWHARRVQAAGAAPAYPAGVTDLRPWALAALLVLILQIALGGWVSSNYAALACTDLPTCQQQWLPLVDFREGFRLWREIGIDYEGGVLDQAARNAIHISHRLWALVALVIIGAATLRFYRHPHTRRAAVVVGILLLLQMTLGINNILMLLPLANAVAHNGVAALLLLATVNLLWHTHQPDREQSA